MTSDSPQSQPSRPTGASASPRAGVLDRSSPSFARRNSPQHPPRGRKRAARASRDALEAILNGLTESLVPPGNYGQSRPRWREYRLLRRHTLIIVLIPCAINPSRRAVRWRRPVAGLRREEAIELTRQALPRNCRPCSGSDQAICGRPRRDPACAHFIPEILIAIPA